MTFRRLIAGLVLAAASFAQEPQSDAAFHEAIAHRLDAESAEFERHAANIRAVTLEIRHEVCRRQKRWWQFWKRCRLTPQ